MTCTECETITEDGRVSGDHIHKVMCLTPPSRLVYYLDKQMFDDPLQAWAYLQLECDLDSKEAHDYLAILPVITHIGDSS